MGQIDYKRKRYLTAIIFLLLYFQHATILYNNIVHLYTDRVQGQILYQAYLCANKHNCYVNRRRYSVNHFNM